MTDESEVSDTPPSLVLDYASPRPPRWPRLRALWADVREAGPWAPRASLRTGVALAMCIAATVWLARIPPAWQLIRSDTIPRQQQLEEVFTYVPRHDAIFAPDADNQLHLWRPWTGEVLLRVRGDGRSVRWTGASADGSRLIAQTSTGTFLWDGLTGERIGKLSWGQNLYLSGDEVTQKGLVAAALSPDGQRLLILNQESELLLWDVSGKQGRLLVTSPPLASRFLPNLTLLFSSDAQHVLAQGHDHLWVVDAQTLQPVFETPTSTESSAHFAGSRRLLLANDRSRAFVAKLIDLPSGQVVHETTVQHSVRWGAAVSGSGERAVIGSMYGRGIVLESLLGEPQARPSAAGHAANQITFLPDERRLAVSRMWREHPGIFDIDSGRHVATLHLPPMKTPVYPPVMRMIVSSTGRHIAAVTHSGQVHVYEQVGQESAFGLIGTPAFAALVASVCLLSLSLWRDAVQTARARRAHLRTHPLRLVLAGAMITIGTVSLVWPMVWVSLGLSDSGTWWHSDGWMVWWCCLCLFAGLGIVMRSRGWTTLAGLALMAGVALSLPMLLVAREFVRNPLQVFDRMWVMPVAWVVCALGAVAVLSLGGLAIFALTPADEVAHPQRTS